MKGEIYNLGLSNANLTKEQLCESIKMQIEDLIMKLILRVKTKIKEIILFLMKIEKLGFQTEYDRYTISELINYYQSPDFKEAKNI